MWMYTFLCWGIKHDIWRLNLIYCLFGVFWFKGTQQQQQQKGREQERKLDGEKTVIRIHTDKFNRRRFLCRPTPFLYSYMRIEGNLLNDGANNDTMHR